MNVKGSTSSLHKTVSPARLFPAAHPSPPEIDDHQAEEAVSRPERDRINSSADFHKGVGAELVGDALADAMALDDVPRLDVIGQNHDVIAHRAACLLNLGDRPLAVLNARPERQARSVRAVEEVSTLDPGRDLDLLPSPLAPGFRHPVSPSAGLLQPQKALNLSAVEAHHDLAADDSHGGGPVAEFLQLIERGGIFPDVFVREGNALLRKKLFLGLAARSPRLAVDDDLFRHHVLPSQPIDKPLAAFPSAEDEVPHNKQGDQPCRQQNQS